MRQIYRWPNHSDTSHATRNGPLPIVKSVIELCSNSNEWMARLAPVFAAAPMPFQYVNVGANTGFNIVQVLRAYGNASVSVVKGPTLSVQEFV